MYRLRIQSAHLWGIEKKNFFFQGNNFSKCREKSSVVLHVVLGGHDINGLSVWQTISETHPGDKRPFHCFDFVSQCSFHVGDNLLTHVIKFSTFFRLKGLF